MSSGRSVPTPAPSAKRHGTSIEWTHGDGFKGETWNPVTGCSHVSPGCMGPCYAETLTARFAGQPGWIEEHRPWTKQNAAHNVRLHPERLDQPLRWEKPRMVFVNSMSDLFHEEIPDEFIARVFAHMASAPQHVFQVLTKRPERALQLLDSPIGGSFWSAVWEEAADLASDVVAPVRVLGHPQRYVLNHVWLGVSIESAKFNPRADVLRRIPAAVRFISAEPLLGSLFEEPPLDLTGIDWVIVGGCSGGQSSPPMHVDWARELRDACVPFGPHSSRHAPIAFFFKQWGSHGEFGDYVGAGPKSGGRRLDGREWNEMPATPGAA